jgi:hypothetical protein
LLTSGLDAQTATRNMEMLFVRGDAVIMVRNRFAIKSTRWLTPSLVSVSGTSVDRLLLRSGDRIHQPFKRVRSSNVQWLPLHGTMIS